MSSMRLLLEGPDLPTLLAQIRTEYGAEARIVQAEKVRRGGVGGFFARERFNIQVEVPDLLVSPKLPTGRGGSPVRSVMDLVDRLNKEEETMHLGAIDVPLTGAPSLADAPSLAAVLSHPASLSHPAAAPHPAAASYVQSASTEATAPPVPAAAEFLPYGSLGQPAAPAPAAPAPPAPAPPAPAPAAHPSSPGGYPSPPHVNGFGSTPSAEPVSAAPVSTQSASFADVMSRLHYGIDSQMLAPTEPPSGSGLPGATAVPHLRVVAPVPQEPEPTFQRASAPSPISTGAQMAARAMRLGVPTHVLAGVDDPADVYRRLLAWVESRPTAPMIVAAPGQVVVVVGQTATALRVAGSLARDLRVDPSAIYLAVPASSSGHDVPVGRLLSDVSEIAIRRQRWQQSVGSTIIVVEADLPVAGRGWLSAAVSALAPTFTWAVAQASTKVDDVVSWAVEIGQVDALALVNVASTGDPAASLAGPLPVGLLDDHRATVTYWMGMLTDGRERR